MKYVVKGRHRDSTLQWKNWQAMITVAGGDRAMKQDDGNPKFGRLLIVLLLVVLFCGALTWFAEKYLA